MDAFLCRERGGPLVAVASHHGHELRDELRPLLAIADRERLREEDPQTGAWATRVPTHLVGLRSRFEVDLNRARHEAVYMTPDDAWGLELWREPPGQELVSRSLALHDAFHARLAGLCERAIARHGRVVVLDLHSYNHRRGGPDAPADDPALNPDVNVGTGSLDRGTWGELVDAFIERLGEFPFPGGRLDVRENVRFRGREIPRLVHERFGPRACCLAIEVKKIFMDEWTGILDAARFAAVGDALASTFPLLVELSERPWTPPAPLRAPAA